MGLGKQVQLTVLPKASCVAWDKLLLCPSVLILKLQSSGSSLHRRSFARVCQSGFDVFGCSNVGHIAPLC